ncbi:hypothetical protein [Mycoplasma sp. Mirounga ES2805-ORL]|uniref:hypothetical protein n=1 Tax=Mycoplasma sp. Mirounga ES2805-ORL TaxID=754514 RepID=UPI00197B1E43|nr:hypothetical protein [Mycoplasma sp. Mirounga ES2805-ORL]QSF13735.1 hypothetical protein JXZ90_00330 [Mycoplasma sp. Mirounga ES2805-ORL]
MLNNLKILLGLNCTKLNELDLLKNKKLIYLHGFSGINLSKLNLENNFDFFAMKDFRIP